MLPLSICCSTVVYHPFYVFGLVTFILLTLFGGILCVCYPIMIKCWRYRESSKDSNAQHRKDSASKIYRYVSQKYNVMYLLGCLNRKTTVIVSLNLYKFFLLLNNQRCNVILCKCIKDYMGRIPISYSTFRCFRHSFLLCCNSIYATGNFKQIGFEEEMVFCYQNCSDLSYCEKIFGNRMLFNLLLKV